MTEPFKPTTGTKGGRGMYLKSSDEMYERITALADQLHISRGEVMRQAIQYALNHIEDGGGNEA